MIKFTNFTRNLVLVVTLLLSFNVLAEIKFSSITFQNLDYGLYWFGYNDAQKAEPGVFNAFYDADKPTFIYIHGWQNNSVKNQKRETFYRQTSETTDEDLSQYWLDRGYNVGVLYWNQFADESEVKDAEAKIYTATGNKNMRWKSLDGSYYEGPSENVAQLLFESIRDNMGDFSNGHLRIAGHSLGNQLALLVSQKLNDAVQNGLNANLLPERVVLLDPFYSKGEKDFLDKKWVGDIARDTVDSLKSANVIIEAYRSSLTGSSGLVGDMNIELMNKTAFSELRPWFFTFWEIANKHSAAVSWYFWSIAFDAPQFTSGEGNVPSAATSNDRTRRLMNSSYRASQNDGVYTKTPEDDDFNLKGRL